MNDTTSASSVHRGLRDVYLDRSSIAHIDGRAGELSYRGYSIHELAEHASFEEVAYLLLRGDLPNVEELTAFREALVAARELPEAIYETLDRLGKAHPMAALRTAVSALGGLEGGPGGGESEGSLLAKGVRLTAQVPLIVAAHHRLRRGRAPVPPDPALGHAANFLYMLEGRPPDAEAARLIDADLVLHAEHGSNASTFAARVVASTEADLHAALTAALAALAGPAHGGAAENVMRMAEEIGDPARAAEYVREKRRARQPIMGFGHRVYRAEDPHARHLRAGVERLSKTLGEPRWYRILEAVVEAMRPYARHGVSVNVDFYAGVVYHLLGIPADLFVPIFAIGRMPGWVAHVLEQRASNILIRPRLLYDGPGPRRYVPIEER